MALRHEQTPNFSDPETRIYQDRDPLIYQKRLDMRHNKQISLARYSPVYNIVPKGFGVLGPEFGNLFQSVPVVGSWLEQPAIQSDVVVKFKDPKDPTKDLEGQAVSITNLLFLENERARPARLYGQGQIDKSPYLIMEYISGNYLPLDQVLAKGTRMNPKSAVQLAFGLCEIIHTCHGAGICRADLDGDEALEHIFWSLNGSQVRLIDWGNAKLIKQMTRSNIEGAYSLDQTSIGKILYQALTGLPFSMEYHQRLSTALNREDQYILIVSILQKLLPNDHEKHPYDDSPEGTLELKNDI